MAPTPPIRLVRSSDAPPQSGEAPFQLDLAHAYRRFAPYVARVGMRILGPGDDIDDLIQDVFLDAHRGLAGLRSLDAARHWLATITVRKARRRLAKRRALSWLGLDRPLDPSTALDPRASADERARLVTIYRILGAVSAEARIAWVLNRIEQEPLETVAEVCGCSRATAHRRVTEAQQALEKGLGDVDQA